MIALTLEIVAIAFLLTAAAVVYVFRQAARAPKGFENLDGFHFGTESRPQSAHREGKAHRQGRAVVPAAVRSNGSTSPVPIYTGPPAQPAH